MVQRTNNRFIVFKHVQLGPAHQYFVMNTKWLTALSTLPATYFRIMGFGSPSTRLQRCNFFGMQKNIHKVRISFSRAEAANCSNLIGFLHELFAMTRCSVHHHDSKSSGWELQCCSVMVNGVFVSCKRARKVADVSWDRRLVCCMKIVKSAAMSNRNSHHRCSFVHADFSVDKRIPLAIQAVG